VIRFSKYHGLGNDYLVIDSADSPTITPSLTRRICDRHLGIGADGILLWSRTAGRAVRILNPDGSEAEKSGNGLRIFARHLYDCGIVTSDPFSVTTPGGAVTCRVIDGGGAVSVEMGRVSFQSGDIPVAGASREVLEEELIVAGRSLRFSAATIGNPHCVLIRESVSEAETRALGPLIERDARFPHRTNVQFVQVLDRDNLRIEIWERGAGYTAASGSSSCAAAAIAHRLGLVGRSITVHMRGGALSIDIHDDFQICMRGPVVKVADGHIDRECLKDVLFE